MMSGDTRIANQKAEDRLEVCLVEDKETGKHRRRVQEGARRLIRLDGGDDDGDDDDDDTRLDDDKDDAKS